MYNVVIIDDEPWSREVVKALGQWEQHGLEVIGEAEDGNQGLALIRQRQPHICVTDMRMPGTEGVELLRVMNQEFPSLKIVVMSGYDDFVYLKQAIRSKAVEYLLKPINPDELNEALAASVRELNKAEAALSPSIPAAVLFSDRLLLARYMELRETIYAALLELNATNVRSGFERLAGELYGNGEQVDHVGIPAKIGNDYLLMLEQFAAGQGIVLETLLTEDVRSIAMADWQAVREAAVCMSGLFEQTIETLQQQRMNRNRLDLATVIAYIDGHYQEAISLESLAQHFYISKEHLSRMFKNYTQENMTDYITRKRMEKARILLVKQGLSIKHVAQLTGYDDVAYFYRVFKKHYGITPGEVRKDG
ncbi:response regulator [Paenibacillaceae bacterium]|nr:response regulator [Paenibacillaceae bacterium]